MKILRITTAYGKNDATGPAKFQFLLDQNLIKEGYDIIVYTINKNNEFSTDCYNGVIVKEFPVNSKLKNFVPPQGIFSEICKTDYNIIISSGYRNPLCEMAAFVSTLQKKPFFLTTHGSVYGFKHASTSFTDAFFHNLYDAISLKYSIRHATNVIATTNSEKEEIALFGINRDKISVIPQGIFTQKQFEDRAEKNISFHRTKLLMVSRISSIRNIEFLLRSFKKVLAVLPETELTIVGDERPHSQMFFDPNYPLMLQNLCSSLKINDHVKFTGALFGTNLEDQYKKADLFVWSSNYENFGQALLEAAYYGLPIVSTPVGIAPTLIDHNEGGFLVKNNDYEAMANGIITLLKDDTLYKKMSNYVWNAAKQFNVEKMCQSYVDLFSNYSR